MFFVGERLRFRRAFTLLEVVMSVVVIAILALVSVYGYIAMGRIRAQSHHISVASLWAQDKLEEYKAYPYGGVPDGNDMEGVYARTWSMLSSEVTVTVTYPSTSSVMNSVTLTSIKGDI